MHNANLSKRALLTLASLVPLSIASIGPSFAAYTLKLAEIENAKSGNKNQSASASMVNSRQGIAAALATAAKGEAGLTVNGIPKGGMPLDDLDKKASSITYVKDPDTQLSVRVWLAGQPRPVQFDIDGNNPATSLIGKDAGNGTKKVDLGEVKAKLQQRNMANPDTKLERMSIVSTTQKGVQQSDRITQVDFAGQQNVPFDVQTPKGGKDELGTDSADSK